MLAFLAPFARYSSASSRRGMAVCLDAALSDRTSTEAGSLQWRCCALPRWTAAVSSRTAHQRSFSSPPCRSLARPSPHDGSTRQLSLAPPSSHQSQSPPVSSLRSEPRGTHVPRDRRCRSLRVEATVSADRSPPALQPFSTHNTRHWNTLCRCPHEPSPPKTPPRGIISHHDMIQTPHHVTSRVAIYSL